MGAGPAEMVYQHMQERRLAAEQVRHAGNVYSQPIRPVDGHHGRVVLERPQRDTV